MNRIPRSRFLAACCEEPYRIFFPLGLIAGIMGVSLWPLYFSGVHKFYPGVMHARLMVQGFMSAFVIGFLGTAGPRLMTVPHFSRGELKWLLALYGAVAAVQIAERPLLGDALFLGLLISFAVLMGRRFARREDLPPPGFALVAIGIASAIAGTLLLIVGAWDRPVCTILGNSLLNQAFVLLLILGVGSFLLPRFLGLPRKQFPESRTPPPGWLRSARIAGLAGLTIVAAFVAEVFGMSARAAAFVRFAAAVLYLFSQVPLHRSPVPRVTLAQCLRLSLLLLVVGLLCQVIWPLQRLAALHVVFIGGFSMITLTVATRVILGHAGLGHLFQRRLTFVAVMALLLLPATALRFIGDFLPALRGNMLSIAAYLWMAGAVVWASRVIPKVFVSEPED